MSAVCFCGAHELLQVAAIWLPVRSTATDAGPGRLACARWRCAYAWLKSVAISVVASTVLLLTHQRLFFLLGCQL
jgi:hypothetical protein